MDKTNLPEFEGILLEESYFLGLIAEGADLELKCLFALSAQHANYRSPSSGELHCCHNGKIVLRRPAIIKWRAGRPEPMLHADGLWQFGRIEVNRLGENRFRLATEWFDAAVATEHIAIELMYPDAR